MRLLVPFLLSLALPGQTASPGYFVPASQIPGIGVARQTLSDEAIAARTDLMIQSQTFGIMRDPMAVEGARRVTTSSKLQSLFRSAAARSGFPEPTLEAIAYLESWGDSKAESPSGPKGIMQISEATAHMMGLSVSHVTRYRVTKERVAVGGKGKKPKFKTVTHKEPYTVTVRDDRLNPDRAIPAAASYLAGMEQKFGALDWAIFAYHCGQGCVARLLDLTRAATRHPPRSSHRGAHVFLREPGLEPRDLRDRTAGDAARLVPHLLVPRHARPAVAGPLPARSAGVRIARRGIQERVRFRPRAAPPHGLADAATTSCSIAAAIYAPRSAISSW